MSSSELEENLKRLDEIIGKTQLTKADCEFIRDFAHKIAYQESFATRLNERQWNYLASSPYIERRDKMGINYLLQTCINIKYEEIDFSKIDIRNFDISSFVMPRYYFDTEEKMQKLVAYLKETKKRFILLASDAPLFKDLDEFNNASILCGGKLFSADDYNYARRIVNDDSLEFFSEGFIEKLKNYYYRTRDPRIWTILIDEDIPIDVSAIKKGVTFYFSYDQATKAASVSNLLLAAKRTDVKIVIVYPRHSDYGDLSYPQKQKNDSALKKMRTYPNVIIEFDNIKAGQISLKSYLKRLNYYDKLAEKIRRKNLSPLEEYIVAFNMAKEFKMYRFYKNSDIYDNKHQEISRNPFLILKNRYEVCVGYMAFLKEILERLGIACSKYYMNTKTDENEIRDSRHARLLVHINDPQYNIDQLIISDPTENSIKLGFLYSKYDARKDYDSSYTGISLNQEKDKMPKLQEEADQNLSYAKQALSEIDDISKIAEIPIIPIPLNKLFWAIRNLKKKTTMMTRKELDKYMSSVLYFFLSERESKEYFNYFCSKDKIDELVDFLDMFKYKDKVSILNYIAENNKYIEMFEDRRISKIYLTNLRLLTFKHIEHLPIELQHNTVLRIFKLEGINIYNISIHKNKISFKAFDTDYEIDGDKFTEPLINFASKMKGLAPFLMIGGKIKNVTKAMFKGYDVDDYSDNLGKSL